jgi:hypothetical protein
MLIFWYCVFVFVGIVFNDTCVMLCRKGHRVSSYSCDSSVHGLPNDDSHDDITLSSDDFPVNTFRVLRCLSFLVFIFFSFVFLFEFSKLYRGL